MKKLFINAPSFFLFIGLMILCWVQVEFAPTKYSYQATNCADEFNSVAKTQFNSLENHALVNHSHNGTPISVGENSEELDEVEGKNFIVEPLVLAIVEISSQPVQGDYSFLHPKSTRNQPLFLLFHSWKNHFFA